MWCSLKGPHCSAIPCSQQRRSPRAEPQPWQVTELCQSKWRLIKIDKPAGTKGKQVQGGRKARRESSSPQAQQDEPWVDSCCTQTSKCGAFSPPNIPGAACSWIFAPQRPTRPWPSALCHPNPNLPPPAEPAAVGIYTRWKRGCALFWGQICKISLRPRLTAGCWAG